MTDWPGFVPASELYSVSSGTVVAHPATQATQQQVEEAVEAAEGRR